MKMIIFVLNQLDNIMSIYLVKFTNSLKMKSLENFIPRSFPISFGLLRGIVQGILLLIAIMSLMAEAVYTYCRDGLSGVTLYSWSNIKKG